MPSEFKKIEEEPKDLTKLVWIGIVVAVGIMLLVLGVWGGAKSSVSVVRARHILIKFDLRDPAAKARAYEDIEDYRNRILKGESFKKIAKEYSGDPSSAKRGGDLAWVKKGEFEPAFEEFAWNAEIGTLSDIIVTKHGFHIVEVLDRHMTEIDKNEIEVRKRVEEQDEQNSE